MWVLGTHGGCARVRDFFKNAAFVACVAFYRFDQVRNKVVSALGLYVDVGPGFVHLVFKRNKAVIDHYEPSTNNHYDREQDPQKRVRHKGENVLNKCVARPHLEKEVRICFSVLNVRFLSRIVNVRCH